MRKVRDDKYGYSAWSEEDIKRYGKFLLLPLVVLILVIVILVVDRKNHPRPTEAAPMESSLAQEDSPSAPEGDDGAKDGEDDGFSVGGMPQVQDLIDRYFTAKQAADAETIYQLFGWEDLTGIDDLRRLLQYDARYTDGYRNIVCYTRQGLTEDSYLVYVSYDLKFKNSLTLAPGLQWNYIKTKEDGTLYLTDGESLSSEELDLAAKAERSDVIMLLRTQVYAKLRQALEEDPSLAESYSILERQGGAAGKGQETGAHEADVQIGTGGSPAVQIQSGTDGSSSGADGQNGDGGSPAADGQAGDGGSPAVDGQNGVGGSPAVQIQSGTDGSSSRADGQNGDGSSPAADGQNGDGGSPAADGQAGGGVSPAADGQAGNSGSPAADGQNGDGAPVVDIQTGQ